MLQRGVREVEVDTFYSYICSQEYRATWARLKKCRIVTDPD
jgi:hypothetical protein